MTEWLTHTIEPWMPPGALKAKDDYQQIARQNGWEILDLIRYNDARFDDQVRQEKIQEWLAPVAAGDLVLHQFPSYMSADFEQEFQAAIQARGAQAAILIHDLEPLRVEKDPAWEYNLLKKTDLIVTHSVYMDQALAAHGISGPFIHQELFDYLGEPASWAQFQPLINFAGTFQKSPWLKQYQGPDLELFGSLPKKWREVNWPAAAHYQGNWSPTEILSQFQSGFGLVWDSDFADRHYQDYTRYNAPHKASLYLRAGLPLIAWSQSYLGQLIEQNHWGLTIDDLADLDQINQVTSDQYQAFQENIIPVSQALKEGRYSQRVLNAIKKRNAQ
ncbi:sugar transferase [Lactobacillaceae bacterium L1_55_11]|nr:sugar transferase [Lactobacillaceae bacterium L1_55_11]